MKSITHTVSPSKMKTYLLLVLLPLLAVGFSCMMVKAGNVPPLFFIVAIIGAAVAIFSVIYPEFGFYVALMVPYFIFDAIRFFNTDLPVGSAIDAMVWITFIGVVLKMRANRVPFWTNCNNIVFFLYLFIQGYYFIEYFNPNGGSIALYFAILKRNVSILLFLYCALQLFTDLKAIQRFLTVWLFLSFLAGAYACYEEWMGLPKFELNYILADPLREALSSLDNGDYRKSSFLSGCTDFGLSMAGTIVIALTFFLGLKTSRNRKLFLLISAILMSMGMAYSGTRTATFMLTLEIFLYIFMTITERRTFVFAAFFGVLFLFILFAPIYGNGTINRLKSTFQLSSDESLQVRDVNRHYIQPYIYTHPIGGGIGTTGVVNYVHNIGHPLAGFPTDSGLLNIVLEQGWIGLLIVCFSYFIFLKLCVQSYYRSDNPRFKVIYLAISCCIFGFVFAQYAQIAIGQVPNGFLFAGLMAIVIRLNSIEQSAHSAIKQKI
ncbi:MAG TPA: O-antigen ligase family protein [Puia sp.]|nr:O-antigen ligase family protein [Puia sp.]